MMRLARAAALGALVVAAPVQAQLPNASTAALGMGSNATASARGFTAVAWNPALLASSGNQAASLTLLTASAGSGLGPIELADFADYSDVLVPDDVKREWLAAVQASGRERGTADLDATFAAAQIGPVGIQVSTSVRTLADMSPGVMQLIMFGNVDENDDPVELDLGGSALNLTAYSTAAVGYGAGFNLPGGARLMFGATGKYTVGHFLVNGDGSTGSASVDPLGVQLDFPIASSQLDPDSIPFNSGSGMGLDLGAALELGSLRFGASVQNVVNTFEWDADKLRYRAYSIRGDDDGLATETEAEAFEAAPEAVRTAIDELDFRTGLALGAAWQPFDALLVSSDFRTRSAEGIRVGTTRHLGAGVQYRLLSWLPIRAGAALITMGEEDTGYQLNGGLGLDLGGWNLAASAQLRETDTLGSETRVMATIFATGLP